MEKNELLIEQWGVPCARGSSSLLESFDDGVFNGCTSFSEIKCNSTNFIIWNNALFNAAKTELIILPPASGIKYFSFPESVQKIRTSALRGVSSLEVVFIPSSVKTVSDAAFRSCKKLEYINIPGSIVSIGEQAFMSCTSLQSFTLPLKLETLGTKSFYNCRTLSTVSFPLNCALKTVMGQTFGECPKLLKLDIQDNDANFVFKKNALLDKNISKLIMYLPSSTSSIYVVPAKIQKICQYAFENCNKLKQVIISDGFLTEIEFSAFRNCSKLSYIYLPDNLTTIGQLAFDGCKSLECGSVVIPKEMEKDAVEKGKIPQKVFSEYCPPKNKTIFCDSFVHSLSLRFTSIFFLLLS